jgi:GTP 3',8-cyclase
VKSDTFNFLDYCGEFARRFQHAHGDGEIGVIPSVTAPFCRDCTRARLSSDGRLYTCLFSGVGHDVRGPLRDGTSDEALADFIRGVWTQRADRYSETRSAETIHKSKAEMSLLGGRFSDGHSRVCGAIATNAPRGRATSKCRGALTA